jgi:uncharacterized coiled-coil protein SlyX
MDEASRISLQKEITELEQTLAFKKHQLEEVQTALAKQATSTTIK